ncbi:MAG: hypothetical protein FWC10_01905 [Lentimicrobiaceae bacterium]|nr:hypothetical protein [Lentimicrobiaceae bacterium]
MAKQTKTPEEIAAEKEAKALAAAKAAEEAATKEIEAQAAAELAALKEEREAEELAAKKAAARAEKEAKEKAAREEKDKKKTPDQKKAEEIMDRYGLKEVYKAGKGWFTNLDHAKASAEQQELVMKTFKKQ